MKTKEVLFILIGIILNSCTNNRIDEKNVARNKTPISERLKSDEDISIIALNSEKDTIVKGRKGTKIQIDKNTFTDIDGNPVKGVIDLFVKEVMSPEDIIRENISTIAEEGILETRGMMKIEAFSQGKKLKLADNKNISIYFPTRSYASEDVKLYYGKENENRIVEWEIAAEAETKVFSEDKIKLDISIKYRLLEDLDNRNAYFKNRSGGQDLLKNVLTFTDEEKEKLLDGYVRIYWILFEDGDLEVYAIEGNISSAKKKEIENKLNKIPFVEPFEREGDVADLNGTIDVLFYENEEYDEENFYVLTTERLGWINCDIFIDFEAPKVEMFVNVQGEREVKVLFKNYDTVISGYVVNERYYFGKVPKEEPIEIIVMEYDNEQDMIKYSLTETVVKEEINKISPYELLTIDELKSKLELLN